MLRIVDDLAPAILAALGAYRAHKEAGHPSPAPGSAQPGPTRGIAGSDSPRSGAPARLDPLVFRQPRQICEAPAQ
ncbi:hypothetical protein GCM10028832_04400 [Streptomyces sparsus]